jgi:hypothetical protein
MTWEQGTVAEPTKNATSNVDQRSSNDDTQSTISERPRGTDADTDLFYGASVADSYRLKSELVAKHLSEIGFGK